MSKPTITSATLMAYALCLFAVCACGSVSPAPADPQLSGAAGTLAAAAGTGLAAVGGSLAGGSGGSGTAAVGGSVAPGLVGRASTGNSALPCDVADIIKRRCQSCHAQEPVAGVPMALMTWEDFTAQAVNRKDLSVAQYVGMRVHGTPSIMPPDKALPDNELTTLDAWLNGGALKGTDPTCAPATNDPDGGTQEPQGPPPDSTCYTFQAHANAVPNDKTPYVVSNQHYACFYFDMPWPEGSQGVYFAPVFDDHKNLVHHFVFYLDQGGNDPDGYVETCTGLHPSSPTMVAGWAPGSDNNGLPPDVGMDLSPKNHKLLLEIHFYHDGVSPAVPTTSGLQVCTSNKKLANTATVSLLGTEAISIAPHQTGNATGTCTPTYNGDIHILRSWPHMHQIGAGMQTIVNFKDGTTQSLGPWPFDFNSQVSYSTPLIIKPGDKLTTTCMYNNTTDLQVSTGTDTKSEMCFNFVTAYPAGALASKNLFGGSTSATSDATACLQ